LIRVTLTTAITLGVTLASAFLIDLVAEVSPGIWTAFAIATLNLCFPEVAKRITALEGHRNDSKVQTSLYIKIAIFRWVNTAMVMTVITPFTKTLDPEGIIGQIANIFFAEIVTTNVIQVTDVWGHIQRHVLAPRAKTQDQMNRFFEGYNVDLAERYVFFNQFTISAYPYSL